MIDPAVGVAVGATAVRDAPRLHALEDRVELRVAHVEGVMVAEAAAHLGVVREVQRERVVDPDLHEVPVTRRDLQAEDLREELGGGDLVPGRHDGMVQLNRHLAPPSDYESEATMADGHDKPALGSLPERAAARWGPREALAFQGQRWTFADLHARVDAAAKGLLEVGIAPGDKVALWMVNRPEWIEAM